MSTNYQAFGRHIYRGNGIGHHITDDCNPRNNPSQGQSFGNWIDNTVRDICKVPYSKSNTRKVITAAVRELVESAKPEGNVVKLGGESVKNELFGRKEGIADYHTALLAALKPVCGDMGGEG